MTVFSNFNEWLASVDLSQFDRKTPISYHEHDFLYDAKCDRDMPEIDSAGELCRYLVSINHPIEDGAYVGAMLAWLHYEADLTAQLNSLRQGYR